MSSRRPRILKYPWHIGHDYELAKLDAEILMLGDSSRSWSAAYRPIPENLRFVPSHDPPEADLMILHVDQWTLDEPSKYRLFDHWRRRFTGPKVVINHGCNMVDGCSSDAMRAFLGGLPVVCNSSTALELWDLPNARYIHHGMSPEEWPETSRERADVLVIQAHDIDRHPEYRNATDLAAAEEKVPLTWVGRDVSPRSFDDYRDLLRGSSIVFNPSLASPNPRSRTEAMLCGLAVVTTDRHGEGDYIEHGVNGYASNDFDELVDCLQRLLADPGLTRKIGDAGRETARERFHIDRFRQEWHALIAELLDG